MKKPSAERAMIADGERLFEGGHFEACLTLLEPDGKPALETAAVLGMIGAAHGALGHFKPAVRYLTRAARKEPGNPLWHYNLGAALLRDGRIKEALTSYRRAVELAPHVAAHQSGLGNALRANEQERQAVVCYRSAIAADPNFVEAIDNLGRLYARVGRHDQALPLLERATRLDPGSFETWFALANALFRKKRFVEARDAYEAAQKLSPEDKRLAVELATMRHELADWSRFESDDACFREALARAESLSAMVLLSRYDEPDFHASMARTLASARLATSDETKQIATQALPASASGKFRLLYFSADFRQHPTSQLIKALFERHDRDRFFVIAASVGPDDTSTLRQQIRSSVDLFVDLGYGTRAELVDAMRSLRPDIAIDLMGYTAGERLEAFIDRVAPIQVEFLGYPGTTGTSALDYAIVDPNVITAEARSAMTENLVVLPRCYQPNDEERPTPVEQPTRAEFGLPDQGFVYCCFNGARKFTRPTFELWMQILSRVPDAILWLLGENAIVTENLLREARARGIDPDRIVFGEFLDNRRHLQRYMLADCALDTFPYGSHTTGSDALWMGCPLVARAGQSFASRVSASLLTAVGAPELVTTSPRDYVDLAIRMAKEPGLAAKWRAFLSRDRLRKTLYNSELFAREIEWAFREMVERHKRGERPSDLQVPALALQR